MQETLHTTEQTTERTKPLAGIYDAHMHLASTMAKHKNRHILHTALEQGLAGGLDMGSSLEEDAARFAITQQYPSIHFACGIYPDGVTKGPVDPQIAQLAQHIELYNPVAIGEIGIDFHWNFGTPEEQIELCSKQIELANSYKLPVVIHNRLGDKTIMQLLTNTPPQYGLMFHCFSSDNELATYAIERKYYISFAGNLTFKNAHGLRKVMRQVPKELLLVETDSPYLTPHPYRGKPNDPSKIIHTLEVMAEYRDESLAEVITYTANNFRTFLSL